ncbi:MAG TPA: cysteine desulfurase family protein [Candidatus Binataceae bacterium]|nr:cysteine desulfurase family protein [Candidatus Binataceae bacterium]
MPIYLDYNAGAPLRPEAHQAIGEFVAGEQANPASVHRAGQRARRALERARAQVAASVGASLRQMIFTSGGTESNNLAIFGVAKAASGRRKIISSTIEHSSILAPLLNLQANGFEIVRIAPDRDGRVPPAEIVRALDQNTALVTLGIANSEVGTIQDLIPLSAPIRSAGALFHIDAAQALGRIPVSITALGCDLMTLSGHKLGAPSGIGALYLGDRARIAPSTLGGPQENGLRAGTPNLLGAIAFGAVAATITSQLEAESTRLDAVARRLLLMLIRSIPGLSLNGPIDGRLPNTLNLTFPGVLGESMLIALDLNGVEVSMGSACAAGAVEPSHVLLAMGRSAAEARSSLRISLGWATSEDEIDRAAEIIAHTWRTVAAAESMIEEGSPEALS